MELGRIAWVVEQRVGKAEGQERKTYREIYLPLLGIPAICMYVCVAV